MTCITSDATMYFTQIHKKQQNTGIWFRGWNLNNFRDICCTSCIKGYSTTLYGHELHTLRCCLTEETRMDMVWGWGPQWFWDNRSGTRPAWGRMRLPCTVMTYIPSDATWHKKQEYVWFRGEDLSSFRNKMGTSCLRGKGTTPYDHVLVKVTLICVINN
jgi:hypothetical protein